MLFHILLWNSLHSVDLNFDVATSGNRIWNLVDGFLVHLHAMNGQAGACVQLFVTDVTFKMLGFLMLDQDLFVVKFSVTVPAKNVSKPVRKQLKDLNDTGDRKHLS